MYPGNHYANAYYKQMVMRRNTITILVVTGVILIGIFLFYLWLKKKAEKAVSSELPSQYADEQYTSDESRQIRYLSSAIQNDINGLNWSHDTDLYQQLRNTSDRVFIAVCADYKRLTGVSLRKDLSGDSGSFGFLGMGENAKLFDAIMTRMNTLQVA